MPEKKPTKLSVHLLPNGDPLGIRGIILGADAPSLEVEARIAARQWAIQNGLNDQEKADARPEDES